MCGIFGYVGEGDSVQITLEGLKNLEYRGYDSAGIGGIHKGKITCLRSLDKIRSLSQDACSKEFKVDLALAHTRWATHGEVSLKNAHPIESARNELIVVHNGIVENFLALKEELTQKGMTFTTDTDTEVIAQLVLDAYSGDLQKAVEKTLKRIEGMCSFAVIHKNHPDQIVASSSGLSLAIGLYPEGLALASDSHAFSHEVSQVAYLEAGCTVLLDKGSIEALSYSEPFLQVLKEGEKCPLVFEKLTAFSQSAHKGNFEHFMLKEIVETPEILQAMMAKHINKESKRLIFPELEKGIADKVFSKVVFIACGSSWYAAKAAATNIQERLGVEATAYPASEFRYNRSFVDSSSLVIAISQSGETADTLAAAKKAKESGAYLLSLCNVQSSQLERLSDINLSMEAGLEIGVASTKAYTATLAMLWLVTLWFEQREKGPLNEIDLHALLILPQCALEVLEKRKDIEQIAQGFKEMQHVFFIGRGVMYPSALEAALKLKEISYIYASGYPAGEMKHGPIALVDENCPTLAFFADSLIYPKLMGSLAEVKARKGPTLAILPKGLSREVELVADSVFWLPKTIKELTPITAALFSQLFAYYMAHARGCAIDQPKNLAKSVTVE